MCDVRHVTAQLLKATAGEDYISCVSPFTQAQNPTSHHHNSTDPVDVVNADKPTNKLRRSESEYPTPLNPVLAQSSR